MGASQSTNHSSDTTCVSPAQRRQKSARSNSSLEPRTDDPKKKAKLDDLMQSASPPHSPCHTELQSRIDTIASLPPLPIMEMRRIATMKVNLDRGPSHVSKVQGSISALSECPEAIPFIKRRSLIYAGKPGLSTRPQEYRAEERESSTVQEKTKQTPFMHHSVKVLEAPMLFRAATPAMTNLPLGAFRAGTLHVVNGDDTDEEGKYEHRCGTQQDTILPEYTTHASENTSRSLTSDLETLEVLQQGQGATEAEAEASASTSSHTVVQRKQVTSQSRTSGAWPKDHTGESSEVARHFTTGSDTKHADQKPRVNGGHPDKSQSASKIVSGVRSADQRTTLYTSDVYHHAINGQSQIVTLTPEPLTCERPLELKSGLLNTTGRAEADNLRSVERPQSYSQSCPKARPSPQPHRCPIGPRPMVGSIGSSTT